MLKLAYEDKNGNKVDGIEDMVLLDANDRPTKLLLGLVAAELLFDAAMGFIAFRLFCRKG